ncbi:MAG TPA: twin-arginine translocase TatA/TatE family subunit [Acidimicrobiales bacterium]|jgi:sec-independent protein translocase protein TatB|nr:twin-arginine translocase TatA/TatE family subunit [Acidimicrobiales bacterium]
MLNLDPGKLLVIGVVAIILLGPDRLPQVARQLGGAWRSFNEFRHRMESEVRNTMPDLPPTSEIARLARSPSALLNHLSNMSPDSDEEPDGSFQPPNLNGQNGTADAADATGSADAADAGATNGNGSAPVDADHGPSADAPTAPTEDPAAAAAPSPPIHVERPRQASQPSGVIVPGDPTLN